MLHSPPATRTRGKLADKASALSLTSHSSSDKENIYPTAMPPAVDPTYIEKCFKSLLSKDSDVLDSLVTKLSTKMEEVVHKAVAAAIAPLYEEINTLRGQVAKLSATVESLDRQLQYKTDDLEQYQRRNCVRVFGIPETRGEDTDKLVVDLCTEKLGVDLPVAAICRSHRLGPQPRPCPEGTVQHRPIIVRFVSYRDRRRVFAEKKQLKGTGIVIREDLTKMRLEVFRGATAIFGARSTWTMDGRVMWIGGDGRRGSATRLEDLPTAGPRQ